MKRFRVLLISLILIMIGAFVLNFTYAEDSTRQMKAQPQRTSTGTDLVYKLVAFIGNDPHQYFYTIYKIFDAADEGNIYNKAIYCLRGGVGFGADDRTDVSNTTVDYSTLGEMHLKAKDVILKYNQLYNLDNTNDPTKGIGRTETINGKSVNIYNAILWVLDEAYLPTSRKNAAGKVIYNEVEYKNELLSRAGIKTSEDRKKISTDDIEVIQQLAIWYFTNYDEQTKNPPVLTVSQANKYITRTLYKNNSNDLPNARLLDKLYQYFIYGAIDNAGSYKIDPTTQARTKEIEENKFKRGNDGSSAEIRTHVLPAPTGYHQELAMTEYYTVIGPIVIDGENTKTVDATNIILYDKQDNPIKKVYQLSDTDKYTVYEFYEDTQDENSQIKFNNEGKVTSITGNPSTQLKKGTKYYIRFYDIFNVDFENKYPNVEEGTVYDTVEMLKGDATHPSEQYNIDEVNIKISSSYTLSTATFLYKDANNQALVELNKEKISDEDSLKIEKKKYFDLSLRKFIYSINGDTSKGLNAREPVTIDTTPLISGGTNWKGEQEFTAKYTHIKEPVTVKTKDKVVYEIRVYNEGDIPGIATEVKDYLPSGLEMIPKSESTINAKYEWEVSENGVLTTKYLKKNNVVIPAFNKNLSTPDPAKIASSSDLGYTKATTGAGGLYYAKLQVECKVIAPPGASEKTLRNIAAITEDSNVEGKADRDSNEEGNEPNINSYNPPTDDNSTYQEDDDDYEPLKLEKGNFDLSLRKYITKVNDNANLGDQTRDLNNIVKDNLGVTEDTAEYKHRKDPIEVKTEDKVIYTIRIYNEGDLAGRATKIVDQLPAGLKFLRVVSGNYELDGTYDETTNKVNLKEKEGNTNLDAYNKETKELKYATIEIECEVTETAGQKDKVLTNIAYISEEYNAAANQTITNQKGADRDSEPATYPEKTATELKTEEQIGYTGKENKTAEELAQNSYFEGQQDEDDFEKVIIKGKIFDLALRKYITKVNDNANLGDQTRDLNNIVKDNLGVTEDTAEYKHRKDPIEVKTEDKVIYTIRIYNEGDLAGRATKIVDQLPAGLKFLRVVSGNYELDGTYDETTNKVNLKEKEGNTNLDAYNKETKELKYTTIEIECEVTELVGEKDKVLTNIAYISEEYNAVTKQTITNQVGLDRDSEPATYPEKTATELRTEEQIGYTGKENKTETELARNYYFEGQQDEDDFEKVVIKGKIFDLALRKYITKINDDADLGDQTRSLINNDPSTIATDKKTATYKHQKNPVEVKAGDTITYTFKVYNEGDIPGYVQSITDYLPKDLELDTTGLTEKESTDANLEVYESQDHNYIYTYNKSERSITITAGARTYPAVEGLNIVKNALFERIEAFNGTNLDTEAKSVELRLKVSTDKEYAEDQVLTNVATMNYGPIGSTQNDRDSSPTVFTKPTQSELPTYNSDAEKNLNLKEHHYQGQQDDDDFEKLVIKGKPFDLSLRKYISAVKHAGSNIDIGDRSPKIKDLSTLVNGTFQRGNKTEYTATYDHAKDPIVVKTGDIVEYTIRVYNEGDRSGYAAQISDYIPEGLAYISDYKTNVDNGWSLPNDLSTENVQKLVGENGFYKTESEASNFAISDFEGITSLKDVNLIKGKVKLTSSELDDELIPAFNRSKTEKEDGWQKAEKDTQSDPRGLYYKEIKVACLVIKENTYRGTITNVAAITSYKDKDGKTVADRDSGPEDVTNPYTTWQEDDDDYEPIELKCFDLALRKFITEIDTAGNVTEVTSRIPQVKLGENGEITYDHSKEPLYVGNNDTVTYTIRVFNEGTLAGYAEEIVDDIPDGLIFLPDNKTNKDYGWKMYQEITIATADSDDDELAEGIIKVGTEYYKETDDPTKADILVTDYLSSAREKSEGRNNLINPFDINKGVSAVAPLNPDYRDVKVAFKVIEAEDEPSRTIINHAQISKDSDDDIDSIPGTWRDEDDDQDIELIKLRYFDLSLLKWVTQTIVTVDGKTTTTETGFKPNTGKTETTGIRDNKAAEPIAKVVLDRKKLDKTSVKFVYKIRVTNEGKPEKGGIEGYAKEITDIIPDGLDFYEEDNKAFGWKKVGSNTVVTKALENKLLKPGESAEVTIVFRWRNNSKNLGLKTNIAEITKDYNIYDSKDIDSTPNNLLKPYEKEQEDDDDFALVVLSIKTGKGAEYTLLITSMVALLAGGLFLVKKYVL